ncbi:MAG: Glycosyltransferase [candidate division CPR2 bacterium GW2011_GWC2_39_10]|uniref:Glycosyltransferase n=2 Tax=Bacteria candidate phyla TaxID=1783234 RepID=A0A0G0KF82_9BACT|nr:MAG: Glycosyltransferase [Candidatus Magasanikbacteria bacterium GW2011_GWA2_37_8]KKQ94467.1 MAG: Glycosyltransferase [candidate division CPR2 bacterium GW2011_GWC2_39_10]
MNITHVIFYPGQGGAEQYIYLQTKHALKNCHHVNFVLGNDGPLAARIEELGCPIDYVKMRSPFDLRAILELKKIFRETNTEVVHTHFLRENFLVIVACLFSKKKVFSTVHRIEKKNFIQEKFNKGYSLFLNKFIAVSPLAKDLLLKEGINEKKIELIPNGVEIEPFSSEEVLKELKIDKDRKVISYVGRMTHEKGHDMLLKAFSRLKFNNVVLVLVGDGDLRKNIENDIKKLKLEGRVILTGNRDKGYEIIGSSDLYVQPSKLENMPLSVEEAMLLGIPIVASKIAAHELLLEDERYGTLFTGEDDLVEKITFCLLNQKFVLEKVKKAKEYAENNLTAEKMGQKTLRLYETA